MDAVNIATIVGTVAGSSFLATFAQKWFDRTKTKADANKTDAEAADVLVDSLLKWQSTLTARIDALEKTIALRDREIGELKTQIAELGAHNVIFTPITK